MRKLEKIRVRWHPRKLVAYLTFVFSMGLLLFGKISAEFAKFTVYSEWRRSSIISVTIVLIIYLSINMGIAIKKHKSIYSINVIDGIGIKADKKIKYKYIYYTQTLLQKIFGLVTIYLVNENKIMKMNDVSKRVIKYVDATKLKGKPKGK